MDKRIFDRRFETILRRLLEIWVDFTKFCKILKICDIDQVIALQSSDRIACMCHANICHRVVCS